MKINEINFYENIIKIFNIKKNDILLVSSDLTSLLSFFKKKKIRYNLNYLIDVLIDTLGSNGTLLFPTYNWDFCKGYTFDYINTPSTTGSLSKIALSRNDFIRTKNPIYSFTVYGKYSKYLANLKHQSCFGEDSPFAFLYQKNGKNLFIGMDYKLGFTMDHYAEEKVGVDYRFFKTFSGGYIDKYKNLKKVKYSMYVRDLSLNVDTAISKKMDNILKLNKCLIQKKIFGINCSLINLKKTCKIMFVDIKNKGGLIYPKKI